jgi:alcohol dehydrogenase
MRAMRFHAHGTPDQLMLEVLPDPVAGPGEAVVDIRSCGLNYLDIFVMRGMPGLPVAMPRIPGGDIAGVVSAVGAGVNEASIGRRVLIDPHILVGRRLGALGEDADGGLCERIAVRAENLMGIPEGVSFEGAAALPIAYGTAHRMLIERGRVQAGELVLVLGASGGVGTASVQIAKSLGATVIACSSGAKLAALGGLGADHLIDYRTEDFSARAWAISGNRGVDVLVNFTGGDTWVPSLRALAIHGRMLTCGATAGFDPKTDIRYIWRRETTIIGANGWTRAGLEDLLARTKSGAIRPVIDRVLPLERAAEGFRALEARDVVGKILINP